MQYTKRHDNLGKYHDPNICKPSQYSTSVKAVCPDAYSFAFDDQKSTFIVPKGGGWEVVMCPVGRSTNIQRQLGKELFATSYSYSSG
ncbi:thaumatin family protein [Ophiocordyceps sinensis CO18]|uniref:Thaumatin family protein n=1 Tax=Ophiocordyceps sinensis (strain Co18 / CGMCC 3.14243) TaxID=911162 RepID=T5AA77_OPHSC|nr:thaumatin family protein [Ophiocordyceps sinensis CO18]